MVKRAVPEGTMFQSLETTWDQSARRGWTAVASFAMQALALSLFLLVPLLTVQRPPNLAWLNDHLLAPPSAPSAPVSPSQPHPNRGTDMSGEHLVQPSSIPNAITVIDDHNIQPAPDVNGIGVPGGTGSRGRGIFGSVGEAPAVAPPTPPPPPSHPLRISHWAEGNLIYRVQPAYPLLAREARIQGAVQLRAIISKNGTIEDLAVLRGHAMLVTSAVEAVKQWRYRPYLLNGEPIEVETEITVNFTLGGN
jgi:periplasmic protein TonB